MTVPTSEKTIDASTDASTVAEAPIADAGKNLGGAARSLIVRAGAVLLLIPVVYYFWFIHQYGVNGIFYDQWDNIGLLTHTPFFFDDYSHTTVAALWTQHGEERWFFPNLIVLALGHLTNFNILTELYLSAVLLVIAFALIILAHRQDVARTRLVFYLPIAFLVFTIGQFEATLMGFNIWVYLVIAMLAATIFLLDLQRSSWLILLAAIGTAVVGSYSGLDALAIWPVGLGVLLWKRRPRAFMLTWLLAAVATTALYFYHYDWSQTGSGGQGHGYVLAHPLSAVKFFFFLIGDLMGGVGLHPSLFGSVSDLDILTIGVAIFLLSVVCLAVAVYGRRRSPSRSPVGPALICYGLLLATLVTIGRANVGLVAGAARSRYVPEDLLILIGCYLCLLERWPGREYESVAASFSAAFSSALGAFRNMAPILPTIRDAWRPGLLVALRCFAILLIAVEVWGGMVIGRLAGAWTQGMYQRADLVAAHAACAPDSLIKSVLFPNGDYAYANIRALAIAAKKDHLSFFATSEGSRLAHTKLPHGSYVPPKTSVLKPKSGEQVRGGVFLVANASANCAIRAVNFQIVGPGGQQYEAHAVRFEYGWLGGWSTKDVPNGLYTVQSTVRDVGGNEGTSRAIPVSVQN